MMYTYILYTYVRVSVVPDRELHARELRGAAAHLSTHSLSVRLRAAKTITASFSPCAPALGDEWPCVSHFPRLVWQTFVLARLHGAGFAEQVAL